MTARKPTGENSPVEVKRVGRDGKCRPGTGNGGTTKTRADKIEAAVCAGAQLVAALMEVGPLNSQQASLIVEAAVKAVIPNAAFHEICACARRVVADIEKHDEIVANETLR